MKTIFAIFTCVSTLAFAGGPLDGNWKSPYVPGQGRTTFSVEGQQVQVISDLNRCSYEQDGSAYVCTEIGPKIERGTLVADYETSKKFARGTTIYKIVGTKFGLVHFKNISSEWIRMLKYDNDGQVVFAISLTPSAN